MDVAPEAAAVSTNPFRSPSFRRLWAVGGIANTMRWLELLAAGLFVYGMTGSGLAVAAVAAARSLPLLCFGAFAGVLSDAVDRRRVLVSGMGLSAAASLSVCLLATAGVVRPWHLAAAAFVSGSVWATEMATRRRMVGESAGVALMPRAIAWDSLTNSLARMVGPLIGAGLYAWVGLAGAFAISAASYAAAAWLVTGVAHRQEVRPLVLSRVARDLRDSLAYARGQPAVLAVLGVTASMNLFAFSYSALVAPLARTTFGVPDAAAGFLAAGEPLGSVLGGLVLARWTPPWNPIRLMIGGSALFVLSLALMPLMPGYAGACLVLVLGGLGLALFGNVQTTLVLSGVPAPLRSRQLGLITVCIGFGPMGQVLIGVLAASFGSGTAVVISAAAGLAALAAVGLAYARGTRPRGR
ncbi:MFS transporter [Roseomonas sp. CCTCC AB2023176]|uniref:MFS transporter n=1 Tax=Roseomonas sp. CCTCC AB2023176 TaxID=3342640 RepID=UPI0035D8DCEA